MSYALRVTVKPQPDEGTPPPIQRGRLLDLEDNYRELRQVSLFNTLAIVLLAALLFKYGRRIQAVPVG